MKLSKLDYLLTISYILIMSFSETLITLLIIIFFTTLSFNDLIHTNIPYVFLALYGSRNTSKILKDMKQ